MTLFFFSFDFFSFFFYKLAVAPSSMLGEKRRRKHSDCLFSFYKSVLLQQFGPTKCEIKQLCIYVCQLQTLYKMTTSYCCLILRHCYSLSFFLKGTVTFDILLVHLYPGICELLSTNCWGKARSNTNSIQIDQQQPYIFFYHFLNLSQSHIKTQRHPVSIGRPPDQT